ncbi:MAG: aminotransferase class IV [Planctomycetota bacterium]|nr:aminotransferase class IV [Planctomycetota bacterium]
MTVERTTVQKTTIPKTTVENATVEVINTDSESKFAFPESVAYRNGAWLPCKNLHWSVTDIATTQGVMLVERLRTAGGRLFDCTLHVGRLGTSAALVGLQCNDLLLSLPDLIEELVNQNQEFIQFHQDVGVVVLLSPGDPGHQRSTQLSPTLMMHLTPIPFSQLHKWYEHGCRLHVSETRNVPPESWSPWIKTRSRLQYYLADNPVDSTAGKQTGSALKPASDSIAVLLSTRDYITDTSISNLILLDRQGKLRSPSKCDILQGVSLSKVESLAAKLGLELAYCDLTVDDFREAQEILMTGTTGFVWAAIEFEGKIIADGKPGPICKAIQRTWSESLGFDFVAQASDVARNVNIITELS